MRPIIDVYGTKIYKCEVGDVLLVPSAFRVEKRELFKVTKVHRDGSLSLDHPGMFLYPIVNDGFKVVSLGQEELTYDEMQKAVSFPKHEELGKFLGL